MASPISLMRRTAATRIVLTALIVAALSSASHAAPLLKAVPSPEVRVPHRSSRQMGRIRRNGEVQWPGGESRRAGTIHSRNYRALPIQTEPSKPTEGLPNTNTLPKTLTLLEAGPATRALTLPRATRPSVGHPRIRDAFASGAANHARAGRPTLINVDVVATSVVGKQARMGRAGSIVANRTRFAQQAAPNENALKLLGAGSSLVIQDITYTPGKDQINQEAAGTGTLVAKLAGMTLPVQTTVSFDHIVADENGQVVQGIFILEKDLTLENLFGSRVDLVVPKGAKAVAVAKSVSARIEGDLLVKLPYRSANEQAMGRLSASILLEASGSFSVNGEVALSGPTATEGITLAGFNLRASTLNFGLRRPGAGDKPFGLNLGFREVRLATPIPNLLTQDEAPLKLLAKDVSIDENGLPSFSSASLDTPDQFQVVHLAQPMDFALMVRKADIGFKDGGFTNCNITADLALPPSVKSSTGDRVELQNLTLDLRQGFLLSYTPLQPLALHWNTFALRVGGTLALDLSASAPIAGLPDAAPAILKNPEWQGLFIASASLELPDALKGSDGQKAAADVANFLVDGNGVTGALNVQADTLRGVSVLGFPASFTGGGFEFERNAVVGGRLAGLITIAAWNQTIGLDLSISSAGLVQADINTSKPLEVQQFGMRLTLSGGSLKTQPGQPARLQVTGTASFPAIKEIANSALLFTDLGIDANGKFYTGNTGEWLRLVHPADIDLGIFAVKVTQVGLANNAISLNGEVRLAPDLPVGGGITFQGLTISAGPKLTVGGMGVKFRVASVGEISGYLERRSISVSGRPNMDCLYGDASLLLDFAGPTKGMGGNIHLLIANGSWAVFGEAVLPQGSSIPLGTTGLGIIGFRGGLGRSVQLRPGVAVPVNSNDIVPAPGSGSWMFLAGVKIATTDGYALGGDLTMRVSTQPVTVDLNGQVYLLDNVRSPSYDRTGSANIRWDGGRRAFSANIDAELYFPTKATNLYNVRGGVELFLSDYDTHFFIGWPVEVRGINVRILRGALNAHGGVGMSFKPQRYVKAGMVWQGKFLGVLQGQLDGTLDIDINARTIKGTMNAFGQVDFKVFSASARANVWAEFTQSQSVYVNGRFEGCITIPVPKVRFESKKVAFVTVKVPVPYIDQESLCKDVSMNGHIKP